MIPEDIAIATLQERIDLARSPDTTNEILMLLTQDKRLDVRRALTEREGLSELLMEQLVNDKSKEIRLRMARHPELKVGFQEILAGSREVAIRVALALRGDAPEELLLKLASSNNRDVGMALLQREEFTYELLDQLTMHKSVDVKTALTRKNDLPQDILLKLAESSSWDVGKALLERKSLSGKVFNQLKDHKDKYVRMRLARRDDLPEATLAVLLEDKNSDVIAAIAHRRDLSAEQIEKLSTHKNKDVRVAIASRNDLPKKMLEKLTLDDSVVVLQAVANRDALTAHLMTKMLSHANTNTRADLAQKRPLPREIVDSLAHDEDDQVRARVASRSDITVPMIDGFVADSSACVRLAVACRSDTPEQLSQQLFRQLSIDDLYLCKVCELLLYINKASKAHLEIAGRKLVFGADWDSERVIDYERLGQLLPLLFSHPAFRKIQELVINIDNLDYIDWGWSFDKKLVALSAVNTPTEIKRIYLDSFDIDLSSAFCLSLNVINNHVFPRLEYLSTECLLGEFHLDLPALKEISMMSSRNEFDELLLMLLNSNLPNLEVLSISAGVYEGEPQEKIMKLPLENVHEIWPHLKSLTIGSRYAYDWRQVFTAPLFIQLDKLVIKLDESYGMFDECDEETDECNSMMCKNVSDLLDALIDRAEYLSNIGSITVGIGTGFMYFRSCELLIDKNKVACLKKLYHFNLEYNEYVGGDE